ncbi:hypothetical protein HOY82DRAFT_614931 [Tuber indicum]|nr:hypothetical protein HOY82DRAFT_614931 [Tuber indicum]
MSVKIEISHVGTEAVDTYAPVASDRRKPADICSLARPGQMRPGSRTTADSPARSGLGKAQAGPEADEAVKPFASRPLEADWPTIVIECGISQSLNHLRMVAHWWLQKSGGLVKIVLLISASKATRSIHIEQWTMVTLQTERLTRSSSHPPVIGPQNIHIVDINVAPLPAPAIPAPATASPAVSAPVTAASIVPAPVTVTPAVPASAIPALVATGAPLVLLFDKIFLRPPLAAQGEGNIILTAHDLEAYASRVWHGSK